jgi:zinc transport system substrate-binding protein
MEKAPGVTLYPLRAELEDDGHHHEGPYDLHLWLSPGNAKAMVADIAVRLSALYPDKASLYQANAKKLDARLDQLDSEMKARFAPLADKPFVAFHDAYQYLEKSYGLSFAGAVTLFPDRAPGARHIAMLREKIQQSGARCVFREPEFDSRIIDNMLEGLDVKSDMLDPEGALLTPGPELYFQLMETLSKTLAQCLTSPPGQ